MQVTSGTQTTTTDVLLELKHSSWSSKATSRLPPPAACRDETDETVFKGGSTFSGDPLNSEGIT